MTLTPLQQKLIDQIKVNPKLSNNEYADLLGSTKGSIASAILNLRDKGVLKKFDGKSGTKTAEHELLDFKIDYQGVIDECENAGIPAESVNHGWYKGKQWSLHFKGTSKSYLDIKDEMVSEMIAHAPVYPVLKRQPKQEGLLSVVDVADPHFGKYASKDETGESYSTSKAESRFFEGIEGLCHKMEREKIDKIVYVGGNDRTHTDNPFGTTTAGTKQDVDGMWHEAYMSAKRCDVGAIERLLTIADVHFVFCPSNHDFMTGFFMADALKSHFHNNPNITFDVTPMHRKYLQYGTSLIGLTHGDGAKEADLSDLMKTECKKGWSLSQYAYWYVHHIHHKVRTARKGSEKVQLEKDGKGMTVLYTGKEIEPTDYAYVEYIRSMSGTDRWHFTNGFVHSPKAIEMFLHHKQFGQIERYSHLF